MSHKLTIKHSFDVFDTCLTRLWAEPHELFVLLGTELQKDYLLSPEITDFARQRQAAETAAWQQSSFTTQPTLAQIYQQLASSLKWSTEVSATALTAEANLELTSVRPVLETLTVITSLHQKGEPVAYISDMYLPQEIIYQMLVRHGFWQEGDQLFVSAEVGLQKHNGRLFRHVRRQLKSSLFSIRHTGDSYRSDYVMAWLNGFRGKHFASGLLHPREREALQATDKHPLGSQLAAVSRLNRLSYDGLAQYKGLWDTVTTGFAPLILAFAHHCLLQAQEHGFSDLFFCSRDGRLPMEAAKVLNNAYGFGFNIHYLRCSRSAWCKTNLTGPNALGLAAAFDSTKGTTLRDMATRLGLELQLPELQSFLGIASSDTILASEQKKKLQQGLESGFLYEQLYASEQQNLATCMAYFTQSGMDFQKGFMLVDCLSRGTMQQLFSHIVVQSGGSIASVRWNYLEFYNPARNSVNSFLKPVGHAFPLSRISLVEALLATNELPLISYEKDQKDIVPVFGASESTPAEQQLHNAIHQACIDFANLACQHIPSSSAHKPTLDTYATQAFHSLSTAPTRRDAQNLRQAFYEIWGRKISLAKGLGPRDFAKIARYKIQSTGELILDGPWMEGSVALGDPASKLLFRTLLHR